MFMMMLMMMMMKNKTTALKPDVFFTELHRLLVTNNGGSTLRSANTFQGQLQTPQSLSAVSQRRLVHEFVSLYRTTFVATIL
jgi:hypothetical protein